MDNILEKAKEKCQKKLPQRPSFFQMKYFILEKEPTIQSKLWTCMREIDSKIECLDSIDLEKEEISDKLEEVEINLQELNNQIKVDNDNLIAKKLNIKIRRNNRKKIVIQKNLLKIEEKQKGLLEELRFYLDSYEAYEKIEKLKEYDNIDVQKEYWNAKLNSKMSIKALATSTPFGAELLETVFSLPNDSEIKKVLLQKIPNSQALNTKTPQIEGKNNGNK